MTNAATTSWDTTATTVLVDGVGLKQTYQQIADELHLRGYPISRNACISKARRLKISNGRPMGQKLNLKQYRAPAEGKPVKPKIAAHKLPPPPVEPPRSHPRSGLLLDLDHLQCRFALGDVRQRPPYLFCTNDHAPRSPYCAHHHAVVYVTPTKVWG